MGIGKGNQMTALRFQTGGRYQTSPASLWGNELYNQIIGAVLVMEGTGTYLSTTPAVVVSEIMNTVSVEGRH